ncbi:MAG: ISAs1 family transposase [Planctomycetaceae bacterium]|nr:ISAs1 family transposase [Planctomycetaceae bacterium]
MVSVWATQQGMLLGQVAVDQRSNEITAMPRLLTLLELRGAIISIDAMGCQKEIAEQIVAGGGDYLKTCQTAWTTYPGATSRCSDSRVVADICGRIQPTVRIDRHRIIRMVLAGRRPGGRIGCFVDRRTSSPPDITGVNRSFIAAECG